MGAVQLRRAAVWTIFLILVLSLTACDEGSSITPTPGRVVYQVDSVFKEFYQLLGGQQVLGPAISGLEIHDALQCQYTERILMCFDKNSVGSNRFTLFPLGKALGIQEEAHLGGMAAPKGLRLVDGYVIYEKFTPLYDRLYGAQYVGHPLTELRINQDLHRVEQFFENVGFYQSLDDPNGPVFLVPYGAYFCGGNCSYKLNEYWSIVKSTMSEQPYAQSITRLGGPGVFGPLLLKPYIADDGNMQQVYTNAIFFSPPDNPSDVRLRPLPKMLGIPEDPLVEKINHEQLVFYEVSGGLGHNVPKPFDAFIAQHGGRDLSGRPISEVMPLQGQNIYRQCFENYCLLYDPAASESMKVRMAPLGKEYTEKFTMPETAKIQNIFSPERISLLVSAEKPNINDNEAQNIQIMVQQKDPAEPMARVEATLKLTASGHPAVIYNIPPTDANGISIYSVPPQPGLSNGTRVIYEVCLNLPSEQPICKRDSYLIWNVK